MSGCNRRYPLAISVWSLRVAVTIWLSLLCIPQAWAKQQFFAAPEYPTGTVILAVQ
ncbi:MAG: hypothetical protein LAO09_15695 [Acidobacteriia bacterium]|nr:hypothetical protein [Terriglobia bacterium]